MGGGVAQSAELPGFMGEGYLTFPDATGFAVWARVDGMYIPKDGTYTVKVRYSSAVDRSLRIVSRNDAEVMVERRDDVLFPATGGPLSWSVVELPVAFEAGEAADLKIVALSEPGVNLDWLRLGAE